MGWEDIEAMPACNLREELLTLLDKESEYALTPGGALAAPASPPSDEDESMRHSVCQWNYECIDYFLFDREVVYLSMHFFDRYLAAQAAEDGEGKPSLMLCHLLALSSLYAACKLHGASALANPPSDGSLERPRATIRLQDFCRMSRGVYCPQMIEEMELSLLSTLQWKLHPPTPTDFLIRFAKILSMLLKDDACDRFMGRDADSVGKGWSVFEVARYQVELAVYSAELSRGFLPSKVALAAMLNAMDSKIVRTRKTIIAAHVRQSFLVHVRCLGGDFAYLNFEGDDIVEVRTTLKTLCNKTIVLPGQIVDESPPSSDIAFTPIPDESKSFEYELPDVRSSSSVSPVSVDHF